MRASLWGVFTSTKKGRRGGEVVETIFVNWEETLKKWFARDEKHQRGRNQPIGTRVDTIKIETECMTNFKKYDKKFTME